MGRVSDETMPVSGHMTGMRLHEGDEWPVLPDLKADPDNEDGDSRMLYARLERSRHGIRVPAATLRRVGWLDQKGRVWTSIPSTIEFDGGSLTPLLIDPGERDGG